MSYFPSYTFLRVSADQPLSAFEQNCSSTFEQTVQKKYEVIDLFEYNLINALNPFFFLLKVEDENGSQASGDDKKDKKEHKDHSSLPPSKRQKTDE
jgi:hypothetical protein